MSTHAELRKFPSSRSDKIPTLKLPKLEEVIGKGEEYDKSNLFTTENLEKANLWEKILLGTYAYRQSLFLKLHKSMNGRWAMFIFEKKVFKPLVEMCISKCKYLNFSVLCLI